MNVHLRILYDGCYQKRVREEAGRDEEYDGDIRLTVKSCEERAILSTIVTR